VITGSDRVTGGTTTLAVLQEVFGFHAFRENQEGLVGAVLEGRDCFAVMPTGGGKSLCYQLPAHMLEGTCLVVSPLISLMKDQVDAAVATGLRAAYLNSSQAIDERRFVMRQVLANEIDLLYVSPERFAMDSFVDALREIKISFVAIDEAHCISEWGHDFRPDYLNLASLSSTLPGVPVCAFTATATVNVQDDIIAKLKLRSPYRVRASFNRPNLFYRVTAKQRIEHQILEFVRQMSGESGIIYRMTRKSTEVTAAFLVANGVKALPYHAGLDDAVRAQNQDAFNCDEADVVVATIAFGMGIDKSDVRYVVHGDLPKHLEGYYQETGRAGRDGEPATCLLFFSRSDIPRIRYFIDQIEDEDERKHAQRCLREMASYAGTHTCRRSHLLAYFGEPYPDAQCGACDVCTGGVEKVESTRDAQILLSAIYRSRERYGATHIIDIVSGANTQRIREQGHDNLKTFGAGRDKPKSHWFMILDNLIAQGIVVQTDDRFPILRLAGPARDVLFRGRDVFVLKQEESARESKKRVQSEILGDPGLFEELRALRKQLADDQGTPPFVIFSDRTLHAMAHYFPTTDEEMGKISGVGHHKLEAYGTPFSQIIDAYLATHPELKKPASGPVVEPRRGRAASTKRPTADVTWDLIRKGLGLEEVARLRGLSTGTIFTHVEALILDGKPVDIGAYVSPEQQERIAALFRDSGSEKLALVVEASKGSVTYEEARLVRAALQQAAQS